MNKICTVIWMILFSWLSLFAVPAAAQYPNRTIRIVVPYVARGSTDIATRLFSESLSKSIQTPVIVVNQPRASGNIGAGTVSRYAPDGNTLLSCVVALPRRQA